MILFQQPHVNFLTHDEKKKRKSRDAQDIHLLIVLWSSRRKKESQHRPSALKNSELSKDCFGTLDAAEFYKHDITHS